MPLKDDGDLIRGLGYVALYAAYLEKEIEDIFFAVVKMEKKQNPKMDFWPISQKLKYVYKKMKEWPNLPSELEEFCSYTEQLLSLLENRNILIHGRIYADKKTGDTLKPARKGCQAVPAVSGEFYELANQLSAALAPCKKVSMFALPRYKAARTKNADCGD
ncbi:MAG: hypothetical protein ING26_03970 [Roseomonas sp.]|nr:hypothetical protein [Roseomonas sp.]MCA3296987.1 hypothetical protein [Roseomonas sp.]